MSQFHSIEQQKEAKRNAYYEKLRKSQWEDLVVLNTQKLAALMELSRGIEFYTLSNHDLSLRTALDLNKEFTSLVSLATRDVAALLTDINTIGKQHEGRKGKVGMDDLIEVLRISELYMSLDVKFEHLHDSTLTTLSEIFKNTIELLKQSN